MPSNVTCSWCDRTIEHTEYWGATHFHNNYCRNQYHAMKRKITRKTKRIYELNKELENLRRLYPQCVVRSEYEENSADRV